MSMHIVASSSSSSSPSAIVSSSSQKGLFRHWWGYRSKDSAISAAAAAELDGGSGSTLLAIASKPTFPRPLPTLDELPHILARLNSHNFAREAIRAEYSDYALLFALQQLCDHFLAGPSGDPSRPSSSSMFPTVQTLAGLTQEEKANLARVRDEITQSYQGEANVDVTNYLGNILMRGEGGDVVSDVSGMPLSQANKDLLSQARGFPKSVVQRLVQMYPHLLGLIRAVLVYSTFLKAFDDEHAMASSYTTDRGRKRRFWYEILGDLDSIRFILVRAHELNLIDLQTLPLEWEALIHSSVDRVHDCFHNLHSANEAMNSLKDTLISRDRALDDIRERFDPDIHQYELMQAHHTRLKEALRSTMQIDGLLTAHNSARINNALQVSK